MMTVNGYYLAGFDENDNLVDWDGPHGDDKAGVEKALYLRNRIGLARNVVTWKTMHLSDVEAVAHDTNEEAADTCRNLMDWARGA